ncbi:hypothetical protein [Bradyrhizobium sp. TM233]|uniref:hypothetical protein n=1 Tax=Bradyrhizobium sp. TM233 TaxID=2599801 RepID=UPI0030C71DA0
MTVLMQPADSRLAAGRRPRGAPPLLDDDFNFWLIKIKSSTLMGPGRNLEMLGPALSLLLAELHKRADKLTNYEELLYSELRDLFDNSAVIAPGIEPSPLMKSLVEARARRAAAGSPKLQAHAFDEYFQNIIRPDDEDENRPRVQINCGKKDCPNKKYK